MISDGSQGLCKGGDIDWQVLSNLLDGKAMSPPPPMNTNSSHIKVTKLIPIFATSIDKVWYWEKTVSEAQTQRHIGGNFMMAQRWNSFWFSYRIPPGWKKRHSELYSLLFKICATKRKLKSTHYYLLQTIEPSRKHSCTVL